MKSWSLVEAITLFLMNDDTPGAGNAIYVRRINKVVEAQNSLEFISHVRDGSILQIPLVTLCSIVSRCSFGYLQTGRRQINYMALEHYSSMNVWVNNTRVPVDSCSGTSTRT